MLNKFLILSLLMSTTIYSQENAPLIFGHRGCRGIMPENTIESFNKALEYEIDGIEWDVVVNKDHQLVISHEEFMDKNYCLDPNGNEIKKEKNHSLYLMSQNEIERYDCGNKDYSKFPEQKHFKAYKPLVQETFKKVDFKNKTILFEIKSDKRFYGKYQPEPNEYVDIILREVNSFKYKEQIIFMCFDSNILELLHERAPEYRLVYLHSGLGTSTDQMLKQLNFQPYALGIFYKFVTKNSVINVHNENVKVFAWTVNKDKDFNRLLKTKLDGIITDFPNRYGR